jgi:hypothetical protein
MGFTRHLKLNVTAPVFGEFLSNHAKSERRWWVERFLPFLRPTQIWHTAVDYEQNGEVVASIEITLDAEQATPREFFYTAKFRDFGGASVIFGTIEGAKKFVELICANPDAMPLTLQVSSPTASRDS